jgi:hypothetical protein
VLFKVLRQVFLRDLAVVGHRRKIVIHNSALLSRQIVSVVLTIPTPKIPVWYLPVVIILAV